MAGDRQEGKKCSDGLLDMYLLADNPRDKTRILKNLRNVVRYEEWEKNKSQKK